MPGKGRKDGVELKAKWREAGAWWEGEPQTEFAEWLDKGVRRKQQRKLGALNPEAIQTKDVYYGKDDYSLRPHKTRDEKVSKACGLIVDEWHGVFRAAEKPYVPLHVLSGYSFGRSILLARELPRRAAYLGLPAMAITDRFALTGAMEFTKEAKHCGIKPLICVSLELEDGSELVLLAKTKSGYRTLSHLVTDCHLGEPRLYPLCNWERLERHTGEVACLTGGDDGPINRAFARGDNEGAYRMADRLIGLYGRENVFVEVERSYLPWEIGVNKKLLELADRLRLLPVAGGQVTHPSPEFFPAQDIVLCSETLCMVDEVIGRKSPRHPDQPQVQPSPVRSLNAERYLRSAEEMSALYADRPDLLRNTFHIAELCEDDVMPGRSKLPQLHDDPAWFLREATYEGAKRYHRSITADLHRRLDDELERIIRLGFADHFLTAWDFCNWARKEGIQFSGRGSVVDSAVSYCLGFSRIDAFKHDLHFDRFLPEDASKRPDIDIDFEAKHRERVRNYIIQKYRADHVATVSAIGAYNTRGIIREVGKALGYDDTTIGFMAKRIHGGISPSALEDALEQRPELRNSNFGKERLHWVFKLGAMLTDVPRNIRAHSSGVIVSEQPIQDYCPVQWSGGEQDDGKTKENLRIIQWDKRSAKHCFDKFDILCLRGQDVLAGTQERIRLQDSSFDVQGLPLDDGETYRAMQSGELIGIPQSASPAMRQAHIRLQTKDLTDASLVQAGIRPGVGGAVKINELIGRKRGTRPYTFEHPDLEKVLGHTYGILVFQEQVDQLLQVFAGYSSGEAEDIREEIHKRRKEDYAMTIAGDTVRRIIKRGYTPSVAVKVMELVAGFVGFGFAQGHALAFAEISIRSIWCQQNYPAEYFAAMLDAQPAGYYGECTLVNEARSRGVTILPVDVNSSTDRYEVEDVTEGTLTVPNSGIRLSLKCVLGLSSETRSKMLAQKPYSSFFEFVQAVRPARDELEQLIFCGAFDALHNNRRALLWAIPSAMQYAKADAGSLLDLPEPSLDNNIEDFTDAEKAISERTTLGLDVHRHLMSWERERVATKGGMTTEEARRLKPGQKAIIVGNPIRLRFPPTPSGKRVVFFDLEDETGLMNVTCFDRVYRRFGHAFICSPYVTLIGTIQWRDGCTAYLLEQAYPYTPVMGTVTDSTPIGLADFLVG